MSLTTVVYSDIDAVKEYLLKETKSTAHEDFKLVSMYPLPLKRNPLQNLSSLSPKPQNHLIYARMLTEEARVNKQHSTQRVQRRTIPLSPPGSDTVHPSFLRKADSEKEMSEHLGSTAGEELGTGSFLAATGGCCCDDA